MREGYAQGLIIYVWIAREWQGPCTPWVSTTQRFPGDRQDKPLWEAPKIPWEGVRRPPACLGPELHFFPIELVLQLREDCSKPENLRIPKTRNVRTIEAKNLSIPEPQDCRIWENLINGLIHSFIYGLDLLFHPSGELPLWKFPPPIWISPLSIT